ncbi:MAG: 4-carboxymuconolactone decarboxylase [Pseudomonadota bacterium]|nr:MAG: 4-carboxymuconolactone decarboxylase [Pseudomonadota bacterium]
MPRIPELTPEEMNPEQKAVFDDIMSGPRGACGGLSTPGCTARNSPTGRKNWGFLPVFQYPPQTTVGAWALIVIARHWCAQFEWYAHAPEAIEAGISADAVEAIRNKGKTPTHRTGRNPDLRLRPRVARDPNGQPEDLPADRSRPRSSRIVDLVGIVGYYCLVSATLNVFDMPLPDGEERPLSP